MPHDGQRAGGRSGGERSGRSTACGAGEIDLRDHVAGPQHDHVVAGADVLARQVLLVVERRELDGDAADAAPARATPNGCRSPNLPTFQSTRCSWVTAVVGGNFQATAQRGSRPTAPSRRCSSRSSTFTTTPSISKSSAPRRSCQRSHCATTSSSVSQALDVAVDAEAVRAQPLEALPVAGEPQALGRADRVAPHRERALGGERGIELADRARGRVARVHERRQALARAPLVERREVGQRHVDLAADLDERRRVVDPQRDRRDRAQVVRDVLADLAVAARGAAHEHAVAVDERDREPVDLRLGDVGEVGVLDPLAREVGAHAGDPGAQLVGRRARWPARASAAGARPSRAWRSASPPTRWVGESGVTQLRVLGLDPAQLVEQRVVRVVADLGVVEDVVAVAVVLQLPAQLGGPLRRRAHSSSEAAGSSIRARSYACSVSMPGSSVRSKWIGVTATLPSATAARSVPSWRS